MSQPSFRPYRWMAALVLLILLIGLALFNPRALHLALSKGIQLAGGSATGNALELAHQPTPTSTQLANIASTETTTATNLQSTTPILASDSAMEAALDTLKRPLDTAETRHWLHHHGYKVTRIIVLSPVGDNVRGHLGLAGPAFQDLSTISGGTQPGDLILYHTGTYTSSLQFPPLQHMGNSASPVTLLAWPGESPRVKLSTGLIDSILTVQIVD